MGGISQVINMLATMVNLRSKRKVPIPGIDMHFFRQIIMSILTGSIRAADKLFRAGEVDTDVCGLCGAARQTSHHIFWECPHFFEKRKPFLRNHNAIRDRLSAAVIGRSARSEFDLITGTAAWRRCGIAGETSEVFQARADRPTKAFIYRVAPAEHFILADSPCVTYFTCSQSGKRFINVYGSLLHGESMGWT